MGWRLYLALVLAFASAAFLGITSLAAPGSPDADGRGVAAALDDTTTAEGMGDRATASPRLRGRPAPGSVSSPSSTAQGTGGDDPPSEGGKKPRLTLEVHVVGVPADIEVPVKVRRRFDYARGAPVTATGGVARFDLSRSVSPKGRISTGCATFVAEHPAFVSGPATIWLPAQAPASRVVRMTLCMSPSRTLRGRVVDAEAKPYPYASVRLFALEDAEAGLAAGRCPYLEPAAWTRSDAEGRYVLQTDRVGAFVLAAGQESEDVVICEVGQTCFEDREAILPDAERIVITADEVPTPRDLVVRTSVAIEGTVHVRGRTMNEVDVWARAPRPPGSVLLAAEAWPSWLWNGENAVPSRDWERCSKGSFRIEGLAPGPHEVFPHNTRGVLVDPSVCSLARTSVVAPATGVVLDLDAVVVHVRVRDEAGPLERGWAWVDMGADPVSTRVKKGAMAPCLLRPGQTCTVRVRALDHAETTVTRTVPLDSDEITWEVLVPRAEPPPVAEVGTVAVRIRGSKRAEITVRGLSADGEEQRLGRTGRGEGVVKAELTPGWWTLRAVPSDVMDLAEEGASPYLLEVEASVLVLPGRSVDVDIQPGMGGLLEVAVRDTRGHIVGAEVSLRDAHGRIVSCEFAAKEETADPSWDCWTVCEDGLLPGVLSVADRALEPGRYELEVRPKGAEPVTRTFEVKGGVVTRVDVALEAE